MLLFNQASFKCTFNNIKIKKPELLPDPSPSSLPSGLFAHFVGPGALMFFFYFLLLLHLPGEFSASESQIVTFMLMLFHL